MRCNGAQLHGEFRCICVTCQRGASLTSQSFNRLAGAAASSSTATAFRRQVISAGPHLAEMARMDCRADRGASRGIWQAAAAPRPSPHRPAAAWMPRTGAIVPPIHVATTFVRDADNQYRRGYCYGRSDNATVRQVEDVLTELEQGRATLMFASGMAAAATAFLALERPAHVVAPRAMYWGLRQWLTEDAPGHGIEATFVDAGDPHALRAAIRPGRTRLVWIETPSNPLWTITDIAEAAHIAHAAGALLAVDSTVPTPVLTRPIGLGADLVLHSATKYLNGHSDVVAGAIVFAETRRSIRACGPAAHHAGRHPRLVRGRAAVARHAHAARARAPPVRARRWRSRAHFSAIRRSRRVLYPGLETHPGHAIAARQMQGGFGGMLSMRFKGGERCRHRQRRRHADLEAGDLARRRREPGRAPLQHRGCGQSLSGGPVALLGWPRGRSAT